MTAQHPDGPLAALADAVRAYLHAVDSPHGWHGTGQALERLRLAHQHASRPTPEPAPEPGTATLRGMAPTPENMGRLRAGLKPHDRAGLQQLMTTPPPPPTHHRAKDHSYGHH